MLKFGTGGLRGIMGDGPDCMNIATIQRATQGLATYILKQGDPKAGVMIGFDSRFHSQQFAQETGRVLAGNGIKVYLLKEMRPTPFVSFACREKKCQAAVMITASHNPKEYNGYKVYWSDGAQVVFPHDTGIMKEVEAVKEIRQGEEIEVIGDTIDDTYIKAIASLQHYHIDGSQLKIIYTSLHGTGITLMPKALSAWGFKTVKYVERQIIPDGNFPTVKSPNPEYSETLQMGIDLLCKESGDILIATDPDADRLAAALLHQKKPVILSGNEIAAISVYYLCETLLKLKKMPPQGAFVTTIVTTELLKTICAAYQKPCLEVLTGFKYIGEKIHQWEGMKDGYQFIFGAEESYGYLLGTYARDKDAIVSGCLIAEIALQMKLQGKTLVDLLHEVYNKFGIFRERQHVIDFSKEKTAMDKMSNLMTCLRRKIPTTLGGQKVVEVEDFLKPNKENLPKADVLLFRLADKSRLVIRPSGTEPKIKIYAGVQEKKSPSIEAGLATCDTRLDTLLSALEIDLNPS